MSYKDSCNLLTIKQFDLIGNQAGVITNQKQQILLLQDIEDQQIKTLDVNKEYIEMLKKEKKKLEDEMRLMAGWSTNEETRHRLD